MIDIYKKFIINYINNTLSPNIIKSYADDYDFNISTEESVILYNFVKVNYESFLNKNDEKLQELKKLIRPDLYQEIINLYNQYKDYYI